MTIVQAEESNSVHTASEHREKEASLKLAKVAIYLMCLMYSYFLSHVPHLPIFSLHTTPSLSALLTRHDLGLMFTGYVY